MSNVVKTGSVLSSVLVNMLFKVPRWSFTDLDFSDAGTPCISDPGLLIVKECIQKKIKIFSVPGASAVSAAMSVSGFDEKYFFYGFFPEKNKDIEDTFDKLSENILSIIKNYDDNVFFKDVSCLIFDIVSKNKVNCSIFSKLLTYRHTYQ